MPLKVYLQQLLIPVFFLSFGFLCGLSALAVEKPQHRELPPVDKRKKDARAEPTARQTAAVEKLHLQHPKARIDFDPVHGSPQWLRISKSQAAAKQEVF